MVTARVSGTAETVPARVALLIEPGSLFSFRNACAFAGRCWGGQSFLMLEYSDPASILATAIKFGIELLLPIDDLDVDDSLRASEFHWPSYRISDDNDPHLMPSASVLPWLLHLNATHVLPRLPTMVSWADDHPLAAWASFLYGQSYHVDEGPMSVWNQLAAMVPSVDIGKSARLPGGQGDVGFLEIGTAGLSVRSDFGESGVFVMDHASVKDLVDCWNLRALGAEVIPWSSEHTDLTSDLLARLEPTLRWARMGDGTDTRVLSVWFQRPFSTRKSGRSFRMNYANSPNDLART
jgi:hypothetical protein